ncbi:hypothetical protein GCM10010349_00030 [Streptomyces flavofungini]|nr:hypothetical protein GCM10010349_00030 [Streptomyces flavofungini]
MDCGEKHDVIGIRLTVGRPAPPVIHEQPDRYGCAFPDSGHKQIGGVVSGARVLNPTENL